MANNFERAVLSGGPKDGENMICNRDYGDEIIIAIPTKRHYMSASAADYYHYYRTDAVKDGRQVYKTAALSSEGT